MVQVVAEHNTLLNSRSISYSIKHEVSMTEFVNRPIDYMGSIFKGVGGIKHNSSNLDRG